MGTILKPGQTKAQTPVLEQIDALVGVLLFSPKILLMYELPDLMYYIDARKIDCLECDLGCVVRVSSQYLMITIQQNLV